MSVAEVARIWQAAGVSTIPILANQTKRPAIRWAPYIATAPTLDEVDEWWGNGKIWGLALICGAVSGNLELTEIESRAMGTESLTEIMNRMDELGALPLWELLSGPHGFTETSPSGGIHFLYRISDHEVPGNTKIAQKARDADGNRLCLVETRGQGGYVITAPTSGICHPSGEAWQLLAGQYGRLPTITWRERCLFHEALRLALDETPPSAGTVAVPSGTLTPASLPPSPVSTGTIVPTSSAGTTPGDDFEAQTDWAQILDGWTLEHQSGQTRYWTRPGKDSRDGASATTGRANDRDRLYVFSTSTEFEAEVPYTKFGAYCVAPETKVLAADLSWVAAGDIRAGDELVGVDEEISSKHGKRKLRVAIVEAAERRVLPCYRIRLLDGREIVATDEHPWLATSAGGGGNTRWIKTQNLRTGQRICALTNGTWKAATDFDSGWLSGLYDGEGWASAGGVGLAQNCGEVLDRARSLLQERGFFPLEHKKSSGCVNLKTNRLPEALELLGTLRPHRLLAKRHWVGRGAWTQAAPNAVVESVTFLGDREVAAFMTSTRTFIAEGLISHNTLLHHNGDHSAAASALARLGFGDRPALIPLDEVQRPDTQAGEPVGHYTLDDIGNAMRLADYVEGRYRWVFDEKKWYRFNGTRWIPDDDGGIVREFRDLTDLMARRAAEEGDGVLLKWANKTSRNASKVNAAINFAKSFGAAHSGSEFGPNRHHLNLANGTLDLETQELHPHQAEDLLVHMAGTAFDETAQCPEFEGFMEAALPDPQTRNYVQRALGYSLLGDADQRALFVLYGPSGTGKSTLIETIQYVMGSYGTTAQSGTFRALKGDKTPTNDLHELRGRRFVTTSETAEGANFDEELLKRLTGRDQVRSRALYQESQEWIPECTLWLATNNPPRFNSDDNAIWSRVKLIPMMTVFLGGGQVFDYARKILAPEAAGILNWLLEGLRQYQSHGLGEPPQLVQLTQEHRINSDSVARFVADKVADGSYVEEPSGQIKVNDLYLGYMEWCRQVGERSLGSRRFMNRMESALPQYPKDRDVSGAWVYHGLYRAGLHWLAQAS